MVKKVKRIAKTKSTAVILSIIIGVFSWLYTYKLDAWKFWTSIGLTLISGGIFGFFALAWVIIDQATKDAEVYENYHKY